MVVVGMNIGPGAAGTGGAHLLLALRCFLLLKVLPSIPCHIPDDGRLLGRSWASNTNFGLSRPPGLALKSTGPPDGDAVPSPPSVLERHGGKLPLQPLPHPRGLASAEQPGSLIGEGLYSIMQGTLPQSR